MLYGFYIRRFWTSYQIECTWMIGKPKVEVSKGISVLKIVSLYFFLLIVSMGLHRNDDKKRKLGSSKKLSILKDRLLHKIVLKIASMRLHNNNVETLIPKFFGKLSIERSILKKNYLKTVSMPVHRDVNQKKLNNICTSFFLKDCFHLKLFWISYQREYTEVIVKKETWTFKKIYSIMEDCLSIKLCWRS